MKNILARGGVEFIAVLLGISLSLYIDKQSELNTKSLNEKNLLSDLQVSLKQDLNYAKNIQKGLSDCVKSHDELLALSCNDKSKHTRDEIAQIVFNSTRGVMSFFPRYGVYRSLVSNSDMRFIQNEELKDLMINLYDFRFKRYENMDIVMENMYQYDYNKFLVENLYVNALDPLEIVKENFIFDFETLCGKPFKKKIRYINGITSRSKTAVDEIIETMISLDELISEELKK